MKEYRHVFDNLYVGGYESCKNKSQNFDLIVSMSDSNENTDYDFSIKDGEHDYNKFKNAVDKAIEGLKSDRKVLVHCSAGLSRSVAVCIATQVCCYDNIGYITAIENARSNIRMPEEELLRSAEKYIKEADDVDYIDSRNEIEELIKTIVNDIDNHDKDHIHKTEIENIIAKDLNDWINES